MNHSHDLFISYAREDAAFALRLAKDLRAAGVSIWIDQLDIPTGARWDRAVQTALENCARFLIILSPDSVASENVQDELALALDENRIIVPVLHRNCKTPLRLRRLQRIDFTQDYKRGLQKLLEDILRVEEKPAPRMKEETPVSAPKPRPEPPPVIAPPPREKEVPVAPRPQFESAPRAQARGSNTPSRRTMLAIAGVLTIIVLIVVGNSLFKEPPVDPFTQAKLAAEDFFQKKKYAEAREQYRQALALKPDAPEIAQRLRACDSLLAPEGMVYIPAGEFMMGDDNSDQDDEKPAHSVRVNAFYLDKYEVTVAQFRKFVEATKHKTDAENGDGSYMWEGTEWKKKAGINWRHDAEGKPAQDDHPVIHVSWNDAKAYVAWTKKKRLPTEAEWEYAARSGSKNYKYSWGNDAPSGKNGGNIADEKLKSRFSNWPWAIWEKYDDGYVFTAPAGKFNPNTFGLYDMTGNVWEWCEDWYDSKYYEKRIADNPQGPDKGEYRVLRGGAWDVEPSYVRGALRGRVDPTYRNGVVGFRCAQDAL